MVLFRKKQNIEIGVKSMYYYYLEIKEVIDHVVKNPIEMYLNDCIERNLIIKTTFSQKCLFVID